MKYSQGSQWRNQGYLKYYIFTDEKMLCDYEISILFNERFSIFHRFVLLHSRTCDIMWQGCLWENMLDTCDVL